MSLVQTGGETGHGARQERVMVEGKKLDPAVHCSLIERGGITLVPESIRRRGDTAREVEKGEGWSEEQT